MTTPQRRRLFNRLAIASLVFCVAIIAAWVLSCCNLGSQHEGIYFDFRTREGTLLLGLSRGALSIHLLRSPHWAGGWILRGKIQHGFAGLGWTRWSLFPNNGLQASPAPVGTLDRLALSLVWPLAITLLSSVLLVRPIVRRGRALRRNSNQRCPRCGYDLRATPSRCPECGAAPRRAGA